MKNISAENIELFDRYLDKDLNAKEQADFEQKLESNSDFKRQLEEFIKMERGIQDAEFYHFKKQLEKWEDTPVVAIASSKKAKRLQLIMYAAAVTVLIFLAFDFFAQSVSNQELAESYFEPYENILTIRGEEVNLSEGLDLYERKDYAGAILIFDNYKDDRMAKFYQAESHMELQEYAAAIVIYEQLALKRDVLSEVVEFHLGLAYLGAGKETQAQQQLESISDTSFYAGSIEAILADL